MTLRIIIQIIFIKSLLCLSACDASLFRDSSTGNFVIENNTTIELDSVYISPDANLGKNYIQLAPGEKTNYTISMGRGKTDGSFGLSYIEGNVKKNMTFGYYTNGMFLEDYIIIDIQPDTVLIEHKF